MKSLKIVIILSTIALLSLITVQYYSIKTTLKYNDDVETLSLHSEKVGQIYAVMNLLLNIETGVRGYLLTGIEKLLEPYETAMKQLPGELDKLYPFLTAEEANSLSKLIKVRVNLAQYTLNKKLHNEVVSPTDLENGKEAMDKIRSVTAKIIKTEDQFIKTGSSNQSPEAIAMVLIAGSLFTLFIVALCIFYIISEFKKRIKTEKELQVALATNEAITRNIDFGIIACDTQGNVIFTNKWITNKATGSLRKVQDFFRGNEPVLYPLKQLLRGDFDTIVEVELEISRQKRVFTINSSPFQINNGLSGTVLSIIDTTDSTEKLASHVSNKQMSDFASKSKSNFLEKMSHEIRTPLNAILGVGEILSLSKLDKEQEHCLEIFKSSALTLNSLVNDVLDLAKIEAGKIDIVEAPFSLKNLVNYCTSIIDSRAGQKGLLFTSEIKANFDHFIGDEGRIRQIALNLLSNAIKFTEKGSVSFIVKVEDNDDKKELSFTVTDSGRGISEDNIGKLFSNFQQETSSITQEFGGTGLGLSLSRELARLMGGDIKVKYIVGTGSQFTFSVMLKVAEGLFVEDQIDANLKFNELKVLLVDDNHENRFIVRNYLSNLNVEIVEAIDGEDAVEKFKQEKYDLVFMDINMPKKDGLTATKEIRQYENNKGIKKTLIIALSANALSLEYNNAIAVGCDDYLTKPISRLRLISMIKKWSIEFTNTSVVDIEEDVEINLDLDIKALTEENNLKK